MNRSSTRIPKSLIVLMTAVLLITSGVALAAEIKITIPLHVTPSYRDLYENVEQFANRINSEGKGKVKVELYHSETLYKVKDIVPALMNGSCEIIFHTSTHTTGSWPEIGGLSLPYLYTNHLSTREKWKEGGELLNLVIKEMDKKYGVRIRASGILPHTRLWTIKKKIETPSDLKGLKIRATGKPDAEALNAFGASPNFLSSAEIYEALQRGTIDGLTTYPGTVVARNLFDVLNYGINSEPTLCAWGYQIYVLNKTFDSWPADVREIILKAAAEYDSKTLDFGMKYMQEQILPKFKGKVELISPTPEAMKKFVELATPTYSIWLKTVDKEFGEKFIKLSKDPAKP